jgi:tripartite-type tricarboxylate transporter receptor subunit TctC
MQHIRAGKLRALCVTGESRYELLPDQALCQNDARGSVAVNWWGVLYPAGTPKNIVDKLHADTVKVLADPTRRSASPTWASRLRASTPAEFSAFIRAETEKYARLIRKPTSR